MEAVEDVDYSTDLEQAISRVPGPRNLAQTRKIDQLTSMQEERIEELFENNVETLAQTTASIAEARQIDAEISELEANYRFARRFRRYKTWQQRHPTTNQKFKKEYLFFEKRELYYEWAADVMAENTAELSKEEADIIIDM
jgi:hypothetical protein